MKIFCGIAEHKVLVDEAGFTQGQLCFGTGVVLREKLDVMSVRVEKDHLPCCPEANPEIHVEIPFRFGSLISEACFQLFSRNMVHVSGRYGPGHS